MSFYVKHRQDLGMWAIMEKIDVDLPLDEPDPQEDDDEIIEFHATRALAEKHMAKIEIERQGG